MNNIDRLITELCPNGVEYSPLEKLCISLKKSTLTQDKLNDSLQFPVINSGRDYYGRFSEYNNEGNAIVIASRGEYAGFVSYISEKFWAGGLCYPYRSRNETKAHTKYIFYVLKNSEQRIMDSLVARGSIPALNKADIDKFLIPLPPLPVQEEIVRILDTFSSTVAELEQKLNAERAARIRQYEHYRDELLNFESKSKIMEKLLANLCPDGLETILLGNLFDLRNGYTPSKANDDFWEGGTIPWFRMEDIRSNGRILSDSIQHITPKAVKGELFPANSIIVATSATIGEHALITVDALTNQRFVGLSLKVEYSNRVDIKFMFYFFNLIDDWCRGNLNEGNFASVDMKRFVKIPVPIPPLSVQKEIVQILDRFDILVNDLKTGLPAEIALRRKQYEHYRDTLLTFTQTN